jgi:hypothetical protein
MVGLHVVIHQSNAVPTLRLLLCSSCRQGDCSTESPYYDYAGTIRGLIEDACEWLKLRF